MNGNEIIFSGIYHRLKVEHLHAAPYNPKSKNPYGFPFHSDVLGVRDIPDTKDIRAERISTWTSLSSMIIRVITLYFFKGA